MKRYLRFFLLVSLVPLLALGCTTYHHRLYSGPQLPRSSIAILFCDPGNPAWVLQVDERQGPNWGVKHDHSHRKYNQADGSFCIELLPGPHTLKLCYYESDSSGEMWSVRPREIEFEAERGFAYTLKPRVWKGTTRIARPTTQKNDGEALRLVGKWEPEVLCVGPIPRFFSPNRLLSELPALRPKGY
jgi:hypothetical protein